jgi:hypothetical protein
VDECTERHSVPPRGCEICDFDSRIALGDVLAPLEKILTGSCFSNRPGHGRASLLILQTYGIGQPFQYKFCRKVLPDLVPEASALV